MTSMLWVRQRFEGVGDIAAGWPYSTVGRGGVVGTDVSKGDGAVALGLRKATKTTSEIAVVAVWAKEDGGSKGAADQEARMEVAWMRGIAGL